MSHTYTVTFAQYDGSGSNPNPFVWIRGTVDGQSTCYIPVYWACIQQANQVGGQAAVQSVLAPILFSAITTPLDGHTLQGPPFPSIPVFQSANIPAPVTSAAAPNNFVTCTQATVPSWVQ